MSSCRACTYTTKEHIGICPSCGFIINEELSQKPTQEMILMRRRLEYFLWCIGILFPSAISFLLRSWGFHLYIDIILPSFPFICLALLCRLAAKTSSQTIVGALIAALTLDFIVIFWLYYDVNFATHGGANIGAGIVVLLLPVILIAVMVVGGLIGSMLEPRNRQRHT